MDLKKFIIGFSVIWGILALLLFGLLAAGILPAALFKKIFVGGFLVFTLIISAVSMINNRQQ